MIEPKRSREEWMAIVEQAYREGPNDRAWCNKQGIHYRAFTAQKYRLKQKERNSPLFDEVCLPVLPRPELPGWVQLEEGAGNTPVYLILDPIRSNLCIESIASILWFGLGLDYRQGQTFLFISKRRDCILALRWHENAFCLLQHKLERGKFHWPSRWQADGQARIRQIDLATIRSIVERAALPGQAHH